ncbi:hypothetical protein CC78DRAFT_57001 [Lojkania enalia]|uniref:Uncharacterized protein n=1 Tax=Lojkania enalia TaxID=147567 RepID=A0A9P4K1I0_9PLEO|nr:hypothetical protein CC78DRAFT_57001 [Didymosphaeria enalia]
MPQQRRFILLDETCASSEIPKMMGRVVADKYLPLEQYVPKENLTGEQPHNTNDIMPDILPQPFISTNRKDVLSSAKENSLSAALTALFGFEFANGQEDLVKLESATVNRYMLNNPKDYFSRLMGDEMYARDVNELLEEKGKAYFVSGFLTTSGSLWTFSKSKSRTKAVDLTAPISAAVGLPVIIPGLEDPGLTVSRSKFDGQARRMHVVEEEIFAVAYLIVKRKSSFTLSSPHVRHNAVLRGPSRVKAKHHGFGEDSDEEIDDEEDERIEVSDQNEGTEDMARSWYF